MGYQKLRKKLGKKAKAENEDFQTKQFNRNKKARSSGDWKNKK